MIYSLMHYGSGLGNQLHRYIAARLLAMARNEKFGVVAPRLFKGDSFMDLNMGKKIHEYTIEPGTGRTIPKDNLHVLEGEFQNEVIWKGGIELIKRWLKTEPLEMADDVCVINFRGGEYTYFPELFLPREYWQAAMSKMPKGLTYEVHTDDPAMAKEFFPDFPIIHDIGLNWRSIRYAKYLILSNSSFAILPAYLGDAELIIAPKYWARYNTKEWINPDNATYSKFTYIHHEENNS